MGINVGQLKELISNIPDETIIVTTSINPEIGQELVSAFSIIPNNVTVQTKTFKDSFDGTEYEKEIYTATSDDNKESIQALIII